MQQRLKDCRVLFGDIFIAPFLGSALGLTAMFSLGWENLVAFDWNDLPVGRKFDYKFLKKVKSPPYALPPPPPTTTPSALQCIMAIKKPSNTVKSCYTIYARKKISVLSTLCLPAPQLDYPHCEVSVSQIRPCFSKMATKIVKRNKFPSRLLCLE